MTYKLYGALGSPYSQKIRALLRYRRLPHLWVDEGAKRQAALGAVNTRNRLSAQPAMTLVPSMVRAIALTAAGVSSRPAGVPSARFQPRIDLSCEAE